MFLLHFTALMINTHINSIDVCDLIAEVVDINNERAAGQCLNICNSLMFLRFH